MRKCPKCAESIQVNAIFCKHCKSEISAPNKDEIKQLKIDVKKAENLPGWFVIAVFVMVGFLIYFLAASGTGSSSSTDRAQVNVQSDDLSRTVKIKHVGCITEARYESAASMMFSEDWVALAKLFQAGVCIKIEAGTKVSIVDSTFGAVKIRPFGSASSWWTGLGVVSTGQ